MLIDWQPYQHIPYRIQCLLCQRGAGWVTGREESRKLLLEGWDQPFKFPQERSIYLQVLDSKIAERIMFLCENTFFLVKDALKPSGKLPVITYFLPIVAPSVPYRIEIQIRTRPLPVPLTEVGFFVTTSILDALRKINQINERRSK